MRDIQDIEADLAKARAIQMELLARPSESFTSTGGNQYRMVQHKLSEVAKVINRLENELARANPAPNVRFEKGPWDIF